MTVWVLGDQLTREHGPLARADIDDERVLLIEARAFARRHAYHPHKLALVFSAMRHFRDELREAGFTVDYRTAETFAEGLDAHFDDHPGDGLVTMAPPSHGAADRLRSLVEERGGDLHVVGNDLFLTTPDQWDAWMGDPPYRQETFYRNVRRETGYLMDGEEPLGGAWNYDDENRDFPGSDYDPPDPPRYEPDGTTREVLDWVTDEFDGSYDTDPRGGGWADPGAFGWPVTRADALDALERFCTERLPAFGPYQDAMLDDEWAMNHALLSAAMNLGLLHPAEVVERAIETYRHDDAVSVPLHSLEGFVRQVVGWREFMRHTYREAMPDLASANQLDAHEDLPEAYWTGETDMACLSDVVDGVRERGYSHHIERLMILANFALIYGVEPRQLNEWFHAAYVDAYHWVTTPNVVEMGSFGHGVFATKPYASSANYVDRMSDYCSECSYAKTKTTGENACPFNALYWEFLGRNEERLRSNHRMGLVYSHWDDKDDEERAAIRERAAEVRALAERGNL
ncbi:cryptochrome/photolyase family protein [Haloglomus litoreum]|uniref:cryptochrome/photolyase family protein n=1 Tax=Haloglomus litoreum TaxID=3034026 RepID=UPI0023E8A63E|nr:cryptochrome/photolyase family protein [Haloglomus sp. DT116]